MYSTCIVWLAFIPIYFGTDENAFKVKNMPFIHWCSGQEYSFGPAFFLVNYYFERLMTTYYSEMSSKNYYINFEKYDLPRIAHKVLNN